MSTEFQVSGNNAQALFTLKIHRGDGMALVAMNWKKGKPPKDFVGFAREKAIPTLLPQKKDDPLTCKPSHPKAKEALAWMGFEARNAILEVLDQAIADKKAEVRAVVYDLNEPGLVSRLEQLGKRLM